ncbi:rds1p-like stress response protein [Sporothrix schenckii 1099-18]|uniref:Rds1p-like stress response protein n=1 Tax=Sporothrix schenckii 1099-18 TaxID=1397361 RepID=A0A0F2MHI0_SPOSC|nr:rds1p-like stress response protein [Sporothrix schenckii 1099-18]KJR89082.1 rds1p-like stress response protein [Sporothrix schenckii 1099-18]
MPSFIKTAGLVAGLVTVASALPSVPRLSASQVKMYEYSKRQNAAAAAAGLTDVDILQFTSALTLEWLEGTFYQQGFAKFPASDFTALGLTQQQVNDLIGIGSSEQAHISLLQSAIAQAGVKPVEPCTYNFGFTDAKSMVATAGVLENVGVSAYLGGGPLISDGSILSTAASILTVEARHQTFVRVASAAAAAPGAFDTALSPKQVFSLAAPFITSCPEGSNLILTAFPALTMAAGQTAVAAIGQTIQLQSNASSTAQFCSFTNGNIAGGTAFSAFSPETGCTIPGQGELAGIAYVNLVTQAPLTGVITDDIIVAGPMVLQIS